MANTVIIEGSGRHIHVSRAYLDVLFGEGFELDQKKMLSQPGQFATGNEKIKLVGPKGEMMVSVLGPTRSANQIELSYTDARALGLKNVPVRESGDVAGTPGLKMVGPAGEIDVAEGAIIAKRHIHMTPADAEGLGVTNGEVVKVLVKSERTTIFDDVVVRVSPSYALAMHIDTDECNAAAAFGEIYGEIVK
jgi:putative phosphotransacetylase